MRRLKVKTLKSLRDYMIEKSGGLRPRRFAPQDTELRRRLDEAVMGFRAAQEMVAVEHRDGWLRAVRQTTGVPVNVLAKRLGVTKHEIFRLEKMERERRIIVANLQRAAEGLGCELVYALVPREGLLKDIAASEREAREAAGAMAKANRHENVKRIERWIGLDER